MFRLSTSLAVLFLFFWLAGSAAAQTTVFSYQGRLTESGSTVNGPRFFRFVLYDENNVNIGAPVEQTLTVTNSVFNTTLDFGDVFPGANRTMETAVKINAGDSYTVLSPRQTFTSAPYAVKSKDAENAAQLGGVPASGYLLTNGDGSGLTNLNGANISNNTINASALAADTFPKQRNLQLLGSLRWDLLKQRYPVGDGPSDMAFDGANLWVLNASALSMSKVRASDGQVLGTFALAAAPRAIAFDGTNVWVAIPPGNVMKYRASDGAFQGAFATGNTPRELAYDGANIWVVNSNSNNVTKLRASDGANLGTFAVGLNPLGIAFDGTNVWVSAFASNNVTKLRASDGANQGTFAVGEQPNGVVFDGANIWVANERGNSVTKLRTRDGVVLGTFTAGPDLPRPTELVFDGANIWVINDNTSTLAKLRASDGVLLDLFNSGFFPRGIVFDGSNIWVSNPIHDTVTKLPVFP
jgi:hypothetical protein